MVLMYGIELWVLLTVMKKSETDQNSPTGISISEKKSLLQASSNKKNQEMEITSMKIMLL